MRGMARSRSLEDVHRTREARQRQRAPDVLVQEIVEEEEEVDEHVYNGIDHHDGGARHARAHTAPNEPDDDFIDLTDSG